MKTRQSNIELLRIVSMLFIVLEHFLISGTDFFTDPIGCQHYVANTLIGFTYIGVNCFILITGYFGADFTWRRLLSLYLICAFYEIVGFSIAYVNADVEWSTKALSYIIFPLSHSNIWYIRCYVILLLLLPVLNAGLKVMDKKQYLYALLTITVLNIYFGWFHKQENFNGDGYNASQMIYLYVIGGYLKRYIDWEKVKLYKGYIFTIWLVSSILWGVLQNLNDSGIVIPHWNGWAYNNPVLLVSAIALFMLFGCIEMKPSRMINSLAAGMFSVLLIHMNRYLGRYINEGVHSVIYSQGITQSLSAQVILLFCSATVVLVTLALIDIPRRFVHQWMLDKYDVVADALHQHIK